MPEQQYNHEDMERTNIVHNLSDNDDWDLLKHCQTEKERYFPLLVKRHFALVVNIGYRFFLDRGLAEDMAQEVFLTVYREIDRLQPGKQPFVHWLCRITSNGCRSLYRKRKSEKNAVASGKVDYWYGDETADSAEHIDDETKAAFEYVNDALQQLKPNERMALVLSHVAELKTREIAPMIKAPEYTVRRLLRRAEEKMRKIIAQRTLEQHA